MCCWRVKPQSEGSNSPVENRSRGMRVQDVNQGRQEGVQAASYCSNKLQYPQDMDITNV